jgi:hypothetical protein
MKPTTAYFRAARAVAIAARDALPELPTVVSGVAAMFCGSIAQSEYRWRRGEMFRPVPKLVRDHVVDFVQLYDGDPQTAALGECLAIALCADFWREITQLAEQLQRGERIRMSKVRQLIQRRMAPTC